MRTHNMPSCYKKSKKILIMTPDLALSSTIIGSNFPCLELIYMVPKVFEPLKFDCIIFIRSKIGVLILRMILDYLTDSQQILSKVGVYFPYISCCGFNSC